MDALSTATSKVSALNAFDRDGVLVFQQILSSESLKTIATEISHIRQIVMAKVATMTRPIKTYSDIAERHLGRFDYRCGFTAQIFNEIAKPIVNIIKYLSPRIDFRYYWGAIPSLSGSGPTDMHRDVYPIFNDLAGDYDIDHLDITLPPYYFTVLIPLVQITPENGPTQFIKGTHKKPVVREVEKEPIYAPLLSPGDVVIFDGRLLHRGSANQSKEERMVAYLTFVANWYHDQTFMINEYLFPELAMKGR